MKVRHILGGVLGLSVIAVWALIIALFNLITTGECYPND